MSHLSGRRLSHSSCPSSIRRFRSELLCPGRPLEREVQGKPTAARLTTFVEFLRSHSSQPYFASSYSETRTSEVKSHRSSTLVNVQAPRYGEHSLGVNMPQPTTKHYERIQRPFGSADGKAICIRGDLGRKSITLMNG